MSATQRAEDTGHPVVIGGIRRLLARNADGSYGPSFVGEPARAEKERIGGTAPPPPMSLPVSVRAAPPKSVEGQGARVVAAIKGYVAREIAAVQRRTLADDFKGSWLAGTTYERGSLVQRGNSTWLCFETTSEMPGASPAWRKLT